MMELLILIFVLWLIGILFPGSGGGYFDFVDAFACLVAGIVVLGGLYFYWAYSMVGIVMAAEWLGAEPSNPIVMIFALLGPIVIPMLLAGTINAYREHLA